MKRLYPEFCFPQRYSSARPLSLAPFIPVIGSIGFHPSEDKLTLTSTEPAPSM